MDEDSVRDPDSIFRDCLINAEDTEDTEDTEDDEIKLALNISLNEYNESYINSIERNHKITETEVNSNEHLNEHLNEQIQLALEISQKEHEDEILNLELIKKEEEKLLNIKNRKKSLKFFSNIIQKLSYTPEDIKLKNKIIPLLDEYYSLNIDFIYLDKNTYTQLYNIIDLYYLIPNKKNKITKITKEEDESIRNIFLLEN